MRNLKKILALALALVMTLSLMTVANAFNDDKDIDAAYTEAVQVLSGLKVFKGVNDGSTFAPKQTITRGEVAAIIYRIVTGDVNDSKAGLYASYAETSFSDVKSTDWYAGYIGYCSNAGLIKGNGAGRFLPATTVNGYQALAMILRAVGYGQSGEFEGSGWELRTASTAQTLGLLKNVSAGSLGNAASREVVAEILFQAISGTNMVAPNSITGYHDLGYTLGYQTFKLERLEGVVTANEYADLDDSSPLAEGKTRLDNRTLDYSSQLTDIGESRYAYVVGSTVLALADTGRNTVFETGAATDISTAAKFQKATGLKDDAESYLNFADAYSDTYEADIRIVYSVSGTYATDGVSIRAGERLSDDEYNEIRSIFYGEADYEDGWIIVGTSYKDDETAEENDVSNDMTFRAFVREYLITDSEDAVTVEGSENGEWLKVVDNDGDGTAEYVFKTEFAMSMITDITKKGVYTFASLETADKPAFEADKVAEADIVTSDELAEGDVVIYTKIDGVYYVDLAEMVTETVDKGGVDKRDETITCDGAVYGQSYIGYSDLMESDVTKAHTNETYDLYLDHFGYVRLYQESTYNNGFVLLTDGYYATDKRTDEFQATIFDVDADKLVDVDVAEGKGDTAANTFIDDGTVDGKEEGTWGRLKTFGRGFITNVAAYSVADDVYTLTEVENASNRVTYSAQELAVNVRNGLTARTLETEDGDRVQTTTDTVYYLVITGGKTPEVISWTGYSNAPEDAALDSDAVGYAVTHKGAGSYDVADVVVYETSAVDPYDLHFVYETNSRDEAITIGYDESEEAYVADLEVEVDDQKKIDLINFYNIYNSGDFTLIDEDYAAEGIYAGEVVTGGDVDSRDYVVVAGGSIVDEISFRTNTIKSYVVGYDRNGYYVSDEQIESYEIGDKVILVTGRNDQDVLYVINVTQSVANKAVIKAVDDLYDAIVADAGKVELDVVNNIANTQKPTVAENKGTWTITVKPEAGYAFDGDLYATVNNKSVKGVVSGTGDAATATFTLKDISKDSTVVLSGSTKAIAYTISYANVDGATVTPANPTSYTVENKDTVLASINDPAKDGYKFTGWTVTGTDANGLGNLTYTAKWENDMVTLTVKFYTADGKLMNTWSSQEQNGSEVTVDLDKLAKFSVNGGDETFGNDTTGAKVTVTGDTTVEVHYVDKVKVTVKNEYATDAWSVTEGAEKDYEIEKSSAKVEFKLGAVGLSTTRTVTYTIEGATASGTDVAKSVDSGSGVMDMEIDISNILSDNIVITVTNISG